MYEITNIFGYELTNCQGKVIIIIYEPLSKKMTTFLTESLQNVKLQLSLR